MYYVIVRNDELYHHGIKGQKWGVRRFQNEDGSLTSRGRAHIESLKKKWNSDTPQEKKSKFRKNYEKKKSKEYQERFGVSKKEADEYASKRAEKMKKVAIVGGTAAGVAAITVGAGYLGRYYCDDVIKKGTTIQTLTHSPDRLNNGEAFYTAYRKQDTNRYIARFGISDPVNQNLKFKVRSNVTEDIRTASTHNAQKAFNDLMKNDKDFASRINKAGIKNYKDFNVHHLHERADHDTKQKFFDELKKRGYSGVHDYNDRNKNGFRTKANIIFDSTHIDKPDPKTVKRLTQEEHGAAIIKNKGRDIVQSITHPVNIAAGTAFVASQVGESVDYELEFKSDKNKRGK